MCMTYIKQLLRCFRKDERGSVMVETVIVLPILIVCLVATYEFFEVHRFKSVRQKATYTIADLLSRETADVTSSYVDNTLVLFNEISNDDGVNQIRISVVKYDEDSDTYSISWSEVRGDGTLAALQSSDVENAHSMLPLMDDGQELILVESESDYRPTFRVGLGTSVPIETRTFTSLRFAPQLCWEGSCG